MPSGIYGPPLPVPVSSLIPWKPQDTFEAAFPVCAQSTQNDTEGEEGDKPGHDVCAHSTQNEGGGQAWP